MSKEEQLKQEYNKICIQLKMTLDMWRRTTDSTKRKELRKLGQSLQEDKTFAHSAWVKAVRERQLSSPKLKQAIERVKESKHDWLHTCEFIDPGFGRDLWCRHEGCKCSKPRF